MSNNPHEYNTGKRISITEGVGLNKPAVDEKALEEQDIPDPVPYVPKTGTTEHMFAKAIGLLPPEGKETDVSAD